MSKGKTKITYVSIIPSGNILEALKEIRKEYGDVIDLALYGVHDVEKELVSLDAFKENLASSHFVFVDGRGGDRLGQIMSEVLSKTDNAVLGGAMSFGTYYGASSDSMFLRLGKFRSKGMGRAKGFSNSRIGRWVLRTVVHFMDRDIDVSSIIDNFDLTSIKDPQKFMNALMRVEPLMRFIPALGILRDVKNMVFILMCFGLGSRENMKNFLLLAASQYGNLKLREKLKAPIIPKEDMIYHPDARQFFKTREDYQSWRSLEKDVSIGMISYGMQFFEWARPTLDLFIKELEKEANVICINAASMSWWRTMEKFFFEGEKPTIDLLLWVPAYHRMTGGPMWAGPQELFRVLERLNVPVLAPFGMAITPLDFWKKSKVIAPLDELCGVAAPEFDGAIEPLPVCAMADQIDLGLDIRCIKVLPLPDRCLKSCRRALRWIKLRQKENKDKKVAIVIYGMDESNLGGGAGFLDVFGSLINLLSEMKRAGYEVWVPEKKQDLLNTFLERGQMNVSDWVTKEKTANYAVKISPEKYEEWLHDIPATPRDKMIGSWGDPPGDIMTYDQNLLLPGVCLGNVFIGLQPTLGNPDNPEELLKSFHDKCTAPIHQYLAFYKWIEEEFDVLIHFGTHGSLEWRAGKEVGMSQDCFPDVLIGDSPHIYVYWVGDASEATLAKRRSYAVMVSHMSSPYMTSGLYDEYQELEDLIHEYHRAQTRNPRRAEIVYHKITQMAKKAHLEGSVEEIYDKIYEMKRSAVPRGLHVLGENLNDEGVVEYVTFALRYNQGETKSLHRILAEEEGYSYLDLLKHPGKVCGDKTYAQVLEDIEGVVKQIAWELVTRRDVSGVVKEMFSGFKKNSKGDIERALFFASDLIDRVKSSDELSGVLRALEGGYLLPRQGGDIIRSPEVLPTGGNMYGFDLTKVPTEAAYERGAQIAEQVLKEYLAREGKYPQSVGIVLWGFETMNTEGETIGEILRLIGVEVVSTLTDKKSGWGYLSDLRVIPSSELGRPRVDVMITICGMFRDQFPHILEMLDKAFKMVSELPPEEGENLVAKHTAELREKAAELGIDPGLCHLRTFGPSESEYGTGALTFLVETSCWKDENDLAEAYISGMKHVYGKDVLAHEVQKCFEYHASNIQVVSQIRDFTDYEITDLDHYFEFTGGLSTAVKKISGKRPHMFISDTTKEIIKTEDIKDAIERGVRTRTLNPKWIEVMLEHGYDGAVNIEDRVENILGLATTTEKVANWVWDEVADRIVLNEEIRKKLEEANPWALQDIIDHLLEAKERGYWEASEERLKELKNVSLEVEGWIEERGEEKPKSWKDTLREKYEEKVKS